MPDFCPPPLRVLPVALALVLTPCAAQAQQVDADWILRALARPAPTRTDFVEVRDSALLKQPLRLRGEYLRPDADTLVREVRSPYAETTTIRAGEARIVRAGKPARAFSLSRAPELASLHDSFGALLAGDRIALERAYRIRSDGERRRWKLSLTPKAPVLAARVREIVLYGQGAELRCIETLPVKGLAQRTLLAGAARAMKAETSAAAVEAMCRAGAG